MPDTLAEPAGLPGGRIMVVYFNHRAALIEVILRFGFTNDILRAPDFAEYEGVEPERDEGVAELTWLRRLGAGTHRASDFGRPREDGPSRPLPEGWAVAVIPGR